MQDYQKLLTEFYAKHNPEKLGQVDYLLNKYEGREEELFRSLKEKYAVTDNSDERLEATEKLPQAEKPNTTEKKADPKEDWQKKRADILRKVKERAEQLRKDRDTPKQPSPPPAPPVDQTEESEPYQDNTDEKEDIPFNDEPVVDQSVEMEESSQHEDAQDDHAKNDQFEDSEPVETDIVADKVQEQTKTTTSSTSKPKEETEEPKKSTLPAIRQNIEAIEETYSIKGLLIGLSVLFLIFVVFMIFNPRQFSTIKSQISDLTQGISGGTTQDSGEKKKKSGIDPQLIEAKENVITEEPTDQDPANEEDEGSGNFKSELEEADEELTDKEESLPVEPEKPVKAIGLSGYIIGYSAVGNENFASSQASDLIGKGFNAGYYWIPDYSPAGSQLYKVYVGPYESGQLAEQALQDVRNLNPQAYVMLLR